MNELLNRNKWWLLSAAWVYTFTFVFNHYWSRSASYDTIARNFSSRLQQGLSSFDKLVQDTAAVGAMQRFGPVRHASPEDNTFYYLYQDSPNGMKLRYWSDASIVPSPADIPYRDTVKTVKYANGFYVMATRKLPGTLYTVVQLLLIKQEYYVETTNLQTTFPGFPGLQKHLDITTTSATPYAVKANNGPPLFYLLPVANRPIEIFNWASLLVQIIATGLLLVFLYRVGMGLVRQQQLMRAFIWMATTTLLLKFSIGGLHFPVNIGNTLLFQPVQKPLFGFTSLGGLLLNLLWLVWLVFFAVHTRPQWLPLLNEMPGKRKRTIAIVCLIGLVPVSFLLCKVLAAMLSQPFISFDVANYFSLGWNTLAAMACLYLATAFHYWLLHLAYEVVSLHWPRPLLLKLLPVALTGLLLVTLNVWRLPSPIFLLVLLWLLATLVLEDKMPRFFFYGTERSVRFIFWLIWYGTACTLLVQSQQQQKDLVSKLQLAKTLASHESTAAASLIGQGLISNPVKQVLETTLLDDSVYNSLLREQILLTYNRMLGGYTTRLYFFDSSSKPLYNRDATPYETLNTIVDQQGRPTGVADTYLYESAFDAFQYIVRKPLGPDSLRTGTFFMTVVPAASSAQAMMPELFKPLQTDMQNPARYDYALYKQGVLISSSHRFPFSTVLPPNFQLKSEYETENRNGQQLLWYNAGNRRLIAVLKPGGIFGEGITVFAYLFSCFVVLYGAGQLLLRLSGPPSLLFRRRRFWTVTPLSIRSKIRRTVILVSLVSFVLIGVATVYFFVYRYQQANSSRLTSLVNTVEKDLRSQTDITSLFTQPYRATSTSDDGINSATVAALADLLGIDINLFDLRGNLTATSQPLLYQQGVVSTKMNPTAYHELTTQHPVQFLQSETIGQLAYQGVYLPVRASTGITLGYINIPYFASQVELNQEISALLVTLINLIAFISILAGVLAFFITNSITNSFYIIGQKMKAISLGSTNEPIVWPRNDEIGVLVQQYNKMLEQLDESARKLAASERENAWREMAKQVAHEIKNPLTPMKLNLQYLQRQLQNDAPNVKQAAARTAAMLVEQIDTLSQIASDFSQLARINVVRVETFDLNEVLQQVVMLYEMDSHFAITLQLLAEPVWVNADRQQVNRLFTNLIKNAGEAVEDQQAIISVNVKLEATNLLISITDNGPGIPTELQSQLFRPNFTTKSSGSGLGLAICKEIVEQANGRIWFTSSAGGPTTFYVSLPIAKN